jgi:uncharacterized cysteine cluster protein YcgN (CxxCxxCC family)
MGDQARTDRGSAVAADVCRRCGRCCAIKVVVGSEVLATPYPCPLLDERTHQCTVFDWRFELNPWCVSAAEGVAEGLWPADCPYARDVPGYRGPRLATAEELKAIRGLCRRVLRDIRRAVETRRTREDPDD